MGGLAKAAAPSLKTQASNDVGPKGFDGFSILRTRNGSLRENLLYGRRMLKNVA